MDINEFLAKKSMQADAQEMQEKSAHFLKFQSSYYNGKSDDKELAEMVTQPFWQSMRLSYRRLKSKGLTLDTQLTPDKVTKASQAGQFTVDRDGPNLIGVDIAPMIVYRSIHKDGKQLYSGKEHVISTVSMLKGNVQGKYAACPNCGHAGRLDSYIDGCDACGARFSVQDFETKVSGFSMEENTEKQIKQTVKSTIRGLGLFTGAMIGVAVLLLTYMAFKLFLPSSNRGMLDAVIGMGMIFFTVPESVKGILTLSVLYVLLTGGLLYLYKKPISGAEKVKMILQEFSAQDFYQNLEYKLRNIHLTDRAAEVNVFASCSLEAPVTCYHDVVDCNMTRLSFISARETDEGYLMDVQARMKLTRYSGDRIRTEYEKVALTLKGKRNVIRRKSEALREYKCPGCGSSLNILEGSICPACDSVFDYSDYGWVIERYSNAGRRMNLYDFIRVILVALYVVVMAYHMMWIETVDGLKSWVEMRRIFEAQIEAQMAVYDSVLMPDDLSPDAVLISTSNNIISRRSEYAVSDAQTLAEEYLKALTEEGWLIYQEMEVPDRSILYLEFEEYLPSTDETHLKLTVTAGQNTIKVVIESVKEYGE